MLAAAAGFFLDAARARQDVTDFLFDQQLQTVRLGVLSRLMKMGNKPWTDRDLAVEYENQFNEAVNADGNGATQDGTRALLRTGPSRI